MKYTFLIALILVSGSLRAQQQTPVTPEMVKQEFLHCWNAYKKYAWGHDDVKPLTKSYRDWHKHSLLMTPVDAFDTMVLMGLKDESKEAKELILDSLSFDRDMEVQSFEITIRLLGGLLSAYQFDGDKRFLALADDLGKRLLPVYNTPTGMPYRFVNLQTGKLRDSLNNPAEIGTALIEFGTLSKLTGKQEYYDKPKNAMVQLFNRRSKIGLVGSTINVVTGEWTDTTSYIGGGIDSYYEYLLKSWRLFGDPDCKAMWDSTIAAVNTYVADDRGGRLWYGEVGMNSGVRTGTEFGSLEAFFPAVLALSGDMDRAQKLEASCFTMWNLYGIEPEEINYQTMTVTDSVYVLRPEIIESAFYLKHFTHEKEYTQMGETFYRNLVRYCRVDGGYARLKNVVTREQSDRQDSFFLAETLKYLYLLVSQDNAFDFEHLTFNTEAHPIRRTW